MRLSVRFSKRQLFFPPPTKRFVIKKSPSHGTTRGRRSFLDAMRLLKSSRVIRKVETWCSSAKLLRCSRMKQLRWSPSSRGEWSLETQTTGSRGLRDSSRIRPGWGRQSNRDVRLESVSIWFRARRVQRSFVLVHRSKFLRSLMGRSSEMMDSEPQCMKSELRPANCP